MHFMFMFTWIITARSAFTLIGYQAIIKYSGDLPLAINATLFSF